jgi:HAD superfamily hydrolase (TIGR01490 family)
VASDDHADDHADAPPAAPGVAERADVVAAATAAAAERGDEAERTEERYARPDADRLSAEVLEAIAARSTGSSEAAFFDLDKTIIARSSTLVMGRTFFKDGLISPSTVLKGLYAQAVYQLVGADHAKMEQMRRAALDLTQGWDAERVRKLVHETVEEVIAPLVYAEALALIEQHHAAGRDVWIVSSSGEEIVAPFAGYLGVEEILATRSGIDDEGRYDGTLEFYAYGGAKATAIRQVADARGYDLTRCYAYSDSITDLPMLSAVGHPTAVNPDRELRAAATAMGWEARDFTAPVRLRDRLPAVERKRDKAAVGLFLAVAIGAIAWRVLGDDEGAGDGRL